MEFKKSDSEEELVKDSKEAINQIKEKRYEDKMKSIDIKNILKIGISFKGKECALVFENM